MENISLKLIIFLFVSININSQELKKDTLFFNFNKNDFDIYKSNPKHYYFKKSNKDIAIYFKEIKIYNKIKYKDKIICFNKFVYSSKFYRKNMYRKLDDVSLHQFFKKHVIFLVGKNKFILVESRLEEE